jgi:hypothetical protein
LVDWSGDKNEVSGATGASRVGGPAINAGAQGAARPERQSRGFVGRRRPARNDQTADGNLDDFAVLVQRGRSDFDETAGATGPR